MADQTPHLASRGADAERRRRQRNRSVAIAIVLVALAIVFYVVTILQMGANTGVPEA